LTQLAIDAVYGAIDKKSWTDWESCANFWHMTATFWPSEVPMFTLIQTSLRRGIVHAKALRRFSQPAILLSLLLLFPIAALAQSGSPFDTGFTALQNLFTGTVAKVASLIAIVIGGYQFAHGEPGSKKALAGVAAGTGIAVLAVNVLSWLWGI
jgi:type IV secretory pathway VirB2 component (pilin)